MKSEPAERGAVRMCGAEGTDMVAWVPLGVKN